MRDGVSAVEKNEGWARGVGHGAGCWCQSTFHTKAWGMPLVFEKNPEGGEGVWALSALEKSIADSRFKFKCSKAVEYAIVWGGVRQPAWLEWENEGQRGGGCHRKPGTRDTGPGALLGLVGHQQGSHSRVTWLIYIQKGSSTILPQFKKLPVKRLMLGGGREEWEGCGWRLGPDRPGKSSKSGDKWWASGYIPKSSLAGFTERLDMVCDEFNI